MLHQVRFAEWERPASFPAFDENGELARRRGLPCDGGTLVGYGPPNLFVDFAAEIVDVVATLEELQHILVGHVLAGIEVRQ